mgnify:CR=1 FL=1
MTSLLLTVALVGVAVAYLLEFIDELTLGIFEKSTINKILSLPLGFAGMYLMQHVTTLQMFVTVPASAFVSLILVKYINKQPLQLQRLSRF